MIDWLQPIFEVLKFFGLDTPAAASGWVVAAAISAFTVWRLMHMDKKYDEYIDKLTEVIEKQETEWRALVSKTDEVTYGIIEDTTKAMAVLTERIGALQLLLLQKGDK